MGRTQKRITIALWGLIVVALAGILVARMLFPRQPQSLFPAVQITLTDQNVQPFSTGDLHGRPWVADFVFTTCGSICPIMSARMTDVQRQTPGSVNLVSFTVDPEHDTPEVLKAYGQGLGADFSRWHFLTGSRQQMSQAAYDMKISVKSDANPIMHSDKFLLVNSDGNVVGIYDGTNVDDVKRLIKDASALAGGGKLL